MTRIAIIGSIMVDLTIRTERVPSVGENLSAQSFSTTPGGKGANAAVAVARAGAQSLLVGRVGEDDFGRMQLQELGREAVDVSGVSADPEAATGTAMIIVDAAGENTILVVNGANDRLTAEAVSQALAPGLDTLDAILINFEVPEPAVAAGVRLGKERGIPVVVDAGPSRSYGADSWADCTILTPNQSETETLVGYPVRDEETARQAARELLHAGPQAVVLKLGRRGALLLTEQGEDYIPAFDVEVVDTTGAGDAFSAALAIAVAEGLPLNTAVRRANAAGALTVTRAGTMSAMPTRQEVDDFLGRQL